MCGLRLRIKVVASRRAAVARSYYKRDALRSRLFLGFKNGLVARCAVDSFAGAEARAQNADRIVVERAINCVEQTGGEIGIIRRVEIDLRLGRNASGHFVVEQCLVSTA